MPDSRFQDPTREPDPSDERDKHMMSAAQRAARVVALLEEYDLHTRRPFVNPWQEVERAAFVAARSAAAINQSAYFLVQKLEEQAPDLPLVLLGEARHFTALLTGCQTEISQTFRSALWVARNHRRMTPREMNAVTGLSETRIDYILSPSSKRRIDPRNRGVGRLEVDPEASGGVLHFGLTAALPEVLWSVMEAAGVLAQEGPDTVRDDSYLGWIFPDLQLATQMREDIELNFVEVLRESAYSWASIAEMFDLKSAQAAHKRYATKVDR